MVLGGSHGSSVMEWQAEIGQGEEQLMQRSAGAWHVEEGSMGPCVSSVDGARSRGHGKP